MSNRSAPAIDLNLRLPIERALFVAAVHSFALACVVLSAGPGTIVWGCGVLILSAIQQCYRWYHWPWCRLIWKPNGTLMLIDQTGQLHPAHWLAEQVLGRSLAIAPVYCAQRRWWLLIVRSRQPIAYRRLLIRLRCESTTTVRDSSHG